MSVEKTERTLRWNVIALAFAGPALLGTILYLLWGLTPGRWCGVLIAGAKEAHVPAPECTSVLLALLSLHRDAIWILGGTLSLVILAIGLAATGMTLRGRVAGQDINLGLDRQEEHASSAPTGEPR